MLMASVCLLGVGIAQELALLRISHRPRNYEGPWIALMAVFEHLESITLCPASVCSHCYNLLLGSYEVPSTS